MKVETLLPLGKADSGLKAGQTLLDVRTVAAEAGRVEALGYDGLAIQDNQDDPYIIGALAAQGTQRIQIATSVAIAFPRSPTVTAMTAWTLAKLSGGRFVLGLGSQVKGHIERRFGMKWHAPGPWMREYIQAVRALWTSWQDGTPVDHQGEHYRINLNAPLFMPAPLDCPLPKIELAAVNPYMSRVAGEVADGLRAHPVCTVEYLEQVMMPAVRKGATLAGRTLDDFTVCIKPLVATARDEAGLVERVKEIRGRIAFYGSTPAYAATFEVHGLGDLAAELNKLSREQRWADMAALVSDDVLEKYAVVGTYETIVERLVARYGRHVTHVEFSIPVRSAADEETLAGMVAELKAVPPPQVA
jgi:probable F420-dependent oxidoreductase